MTLSEWVNSLNNPTRARYVADSLWRQGIRASDRVVIELQYNHTPEETDILCAILEEWERTANHNLENYNPDLGF